MSATEESSPHRVVDAASAATSDVAREPLAKLEWRCRRGMKELDLLLVRYLRERHGLAPGAELAVFAEFLELPDPEIARYLVWGDVPPDPAHAALCRRILQSN